MPTVKMADASKEARGFYVPQFELHVGHRPKPDPNAPPPPPQPMPKHVLRDITEITYKDKLDEIDSCEITVNNWDMGPHKLASGLGTDAEGWEKPRAKYIGAESLDEEGKPVGSDPNRDYWSVFDPCADVVELYLGYAGQLVKMMDGTFTTLEPSFPASGAPTLQVRMLNLLHKLRRKKYSTSWPNDKWPVNKPVIDSEVAEWIAKQTDPDLGNQFRFPLDIKTDEGAKLIEPPLEFLVQKNQFDIDFLWRRAKVRGYDIFVVLEKDTGKAKLNFGPSADTFDPIVYSLEWGQSLIDLKATLTTANQYKSVTVRAFIRSTQKVIEKKASIDDKDFVKDTKNIGYLLDQCDPKEDFVEERVVSSEKEAEDLAKSLLTNHLKKMLRVTGTTIGLPKLRAGSVIMLGEKGSLGSRLQGQYFVTATTHTFNSSGYTTRFEARRIGAESGALS